LVFKITDDQDSDDSADITSYNNSEPNSARSRGFFESPLSKKSKTGSKPTANKPKGTVTKVIREIRKFVPDEPLPSDNEEAAMTETEQDDEESVAETGTTRSEIDEVEDDDNSEYIEEDEDDWVPSAASASNRNKTPKAKVVPRHPSPSPSPVRGKGAQQKMLAERNHLFKLKKQMDNLVLDDPNDSVVILPATKYKAHQQSSTDEMEDVVMGISAGKKKKR
jgi:kinesin family protein 20